VESNSYYEKKHNLTINIKNPAEDKYHHELPDRLRSLLYRPFDFIADPRNARWQTGRDALHSIDQRRPLPDFL
jgi:hypothetical protein